MHVILRKAVSCKFGIPCALLQHIRYETSWLSLVRKFILYTEKEKVCGNISESYRVQDRLSFVVGLRV
jgi:hypothetical protein